MKFIEIWRNEESLLIINCEDIRAMDVKGKEFVFYLFSEQTIRVSSYAGCLVQFSNFLSNEDTQRVFKFLPKQKEGEK